MTPPTLYHYTSFETFLKIAESGRVWATHFEALNDREELKYARSLLFSLADSLDKGPPPESGESGPAHSRRECAERATESLKGLRYACVASFSEEPDLLSQWWAYGDGGYGVAIGFSSETGCRLFKTSPGVSLERVIYDPATHVKTLLDVLRSTGTNSSSSGAASSVLACPRCRAVQEGFECIALRMKDPSWMEEREWRLIVRSKLTRLKPRDMIRNGRTAHSVYVVYPASDARLKIDEVVVGSARYADREATLAAVSRALLPNQRRFKNVPVVRMSRATLR